MSKQSGEFPDVDEAPKKKVPRKRHGRYEIWSRWKGSPSLKREWSPWHRCRRYETRELAEKNLAKLQRQYAGQFKDWSQYELRVRED